MATDRQIAANRRNAVRSTGPRTVAGKRTSRLNALTHGASALTPVVPGVESEADWQDHRAGILASLQPVGRLELALADRVVLLLWRLDRLARYEQDQIVMGREDVPHDVSAQFKALWNDRVKASTVEAARQEIHRARADLDDLLNHLRAPDHAPIGLAAARRLLTAVANTQATGLVDLGLPEDLIPMDDADDAGTTRRMGDVRRALWLMTTRFGGTPTELTGPVLAAARSRLAAAEQRLANLERTADRLTRQRALPDGATMDHLARHEAHLTRQLTQLLHELQRLQAARGGSAVAPPPAVDVHVTHG